MMTNSGGEKSLGGKSVGDKFLRQMSVGHKSVGEGPVGEWSLGEKCVSATYAVGLTRDIRSAWLQAFVPPL